MTLSFSTQINGKPNYFIEKIWEAILPDPKLEYLVYQKAYLEKFGEYWDGTGDCTYEPVDPKRHTIREDKNNRWQAGKIIHPVINNRTPDRFQFAPCFPCISTQYFQVLYEHGKPTVYMGNTSEDWMPFYIEDAKEGVVYGEDDMAKLAVNDGFDSTKDFFDYFNKDFTGKILHFTNLRY